MINLCKSCALRGCPGAVHYLLLTIYYSQILTCFYHIISIFYTFSLLIFYFFTQHTIFIVFIYFIFFFSTLLRYLFLPYSFFLYSFHNILLLFVILYLCFFDNKLIVEYLYSFLQKKAIFLLINYYEKQTFLKKLILDIFQILKALIQPMICLLVT